MKKQSLGPWIVLGVAYFLSMVAFVITAMSIPDAENTNGETSIVPFVLLLVFYLLTIALIIPPIVWLCQTHKQMTDLGFQLPSRILYFVPIISIYAIYKYCEAMERVTGNRRSGIAGFLIHAFTHIYIFLFYAQSGYNQLPPPQNHQPSHPQQYPQPPSPPR